MDGALVRLVPIGFAGGISAALAFARAEWRNRWRTLGALSVGLGLASAVVFVALAGANRTGSAYDRLVETTDRYTLQIQDDAEGAPVLPAIEELPGVAASDRMMVTFGSARAGDRTADEIVVVAGIKDRYGRDIDKPLIQAGRMPDPSKPREILLNNHSAKALRAGPGDTVEIQTLGEDQFFDVVFNGAPPGEPTGPLLELTVAGVGRLPDDVDQPDAAAIVSSQVFEAGGFGFFDNITWVRLENGDAGSAAFREAVEALPGHADGSVYFTAATDANERVIDALSVQRVGLLVFGVVAFGVVLLATGQALLRQIADSDENADALAAIGMRRSERAAALTMPFTLVALLAASVAVPAAILASPVLPSGFARAVEPDPGVYADWGVLLPGAGAVVLIVVALSALAAVRSVVRARRSELDAPSRIAAFAARAGLGPAGMTGLRLALEPGRGQRRVPARSTLAGVTVGVAGVVAVMAFGAGMDRVTSTPRLHGWTWDIELLGSEEPGEADRVADRLRDAPGIDAAARGLILNATFGDGVEMNAVALTPLRGRIDVPIVEGRAPTGPDEVAIGPGVEGFAVGDEVVARGVDGEPATFRVIGAHVIALEDGFANNALLTPEGLARLEGSEDVTRTFFLDVAGSPDEVLASITDAEWHGPEFPVALANLEEARDIPTALAAFLAVLAVLTLAHALLVGLRRRWRDVAVLRALGLEGRQLRRIVTVQATVLAVTGLVVGTVLGLGAGRTVWTQFAEGLDVVVEAVTPIGGIAAAAAGFVVTANVIAIGRAWAARRRPSAAALQPE